MLNSHNYRHCKQYDINYIMNRYIMKMLLHPQSSLGYFNLKSSTFPFLISFTSFFFAFSAFFAAFSVWPFLPSSYVNQSLNKN